MRIIGHIPHPLVKITVFQLHLKYAVKLETGLMEQTWKIRESDDINGMAAISRLVDDTFIEKAMARFGEMNVELGDAFSRLADRNNSTSEDIAS
jgi:hypothetical protein